MTDYICKSIVHQPYGRANQFAGLVARMALSGSTMSGHMTLNQSLGRSSTALATFPLREKDIQLLWSAM